MAFPPRWTKLIAGKSRPSARDMNENSATVQAFARSAPANSMVTASGIITRRTSSSVPLAERTFRLEDGPDGSNLYDGILQVATAVNTWTDDSDTTVRKVYLVGFTTSNLPDAGSGNEWHDKYIRAVYEGMGTGGTEIWHVHFIASAVLGLIADPT